jgi:hypothetical protein
MHHAMKTYEETEIYSIIPDLGSGWTEWSASRLGYFIPRERAPDTHWVGGWVDLSAGLDAVE